MQSGTGVYYQAMPAEGPDGKNVMKLIPVKKVNGQFVHTQALPSRNVSLPAHESPVPLPQNRVPTLQPTADGRFILKSQLEVNTVFNSVKSQHRGANVLLQSAANQLYPIVTHNMTQNTLPSPVQSDNKAVIVSNSPPLPNTVKPPAIQSGHYLQIPSNAMVRSLPASALPSSIKNRICHSANGSSPAKGLQMVVCVSPVSSLKLDQHAPCLTKPSEFPQASAPTSAAGVVKSPEKSSKNNQTGITPIKWVVEEREGSSALIPVTSPNMPSDIIKAVKQMELSRSPNQVAKEPVASDISKEEVTTVNDNALVMCNGKVYLVTKKNSQVMKDILTNAESKLQPKVSAQSLTTLGPANTSQTQGPKRLADNKKPCDIIDLCDDDDESSTCTSSEKIIVPSDTVSEHDEDSNVIFVSYIPPKSSETETNKEVREIKSQTSCVKDTENTDSETESMETGGEVNSGHSAEVDASECEDGSANGAAHEGSEALSEKPDVVCGQQTDITEKQTFEKTVPDPVHQPKSDSELRRTFGITFDLSVSLQKVDVCKESQAGHPQSERWLSNKRTLDGICKLINDSNIETKIKQLIQAQVVKPGKRRRLERNTDKNGTDTFSLIDANSSTLSNSLFDCDAKIQRASAKQSRDRQAFQTCQAAEEKNSSISSAGNVSSISTGLACTGSTKEEEQTCTAKCEGDSLDCCSGLRKTPPRSSKGRGRACTACPCGTKVGGVAGNLVSKLREKPDLFSSVYSAKSVSNESEIVESSVSSSTNCNSASGNSGNQMAHADFSTSPSESQPAKTVTYSSSSRSAQDDACEKSPSSESETDAQKAYVLNEAKNVSSSAHTSYRMPSELYSELLDPEEIKRQERIKRLKELLQEKEAVLEKLRESM